MGMGGMGKGGVRRRGMGRVKGGRNGRMEAWRQ